MDKPKDYLPDNAKCVFEGKIYEVRQWEQKMYDGTTKTFEKVKRHNTATVIVVNKGKLLLQRQQQPHRNHFLSLPGGKCEEGENPIDSAARELLEETGLKSKNLFLRKITPSPYSTMIRQNNYFIAKDCEKVQAMNLDNGEKIENYLIDFDEFLMLSENPDFRDSDLKTELLKMRLHPEELEKFKKLLFE